MIKTFRSLAFAGLLMTELALCPTVLAGELSKFLSALDDTRSSECRTDIRAVFDAKLRQVRPAFLSSDVAQIAICLKDVSPLVALAADLKPARRSGKTAILEAEYVQIEDQSPRISPYFALGYSDDSQARLSRECDANDQKCVQSMVLATELSRKLESLKSENTYAKSRACQGELDCIQKIRRIAADRLMKDGLFRDRAEAELAIQVIDEIASRPPVKALAGGFWSSGAAGGHMIDGHYQITERAFENKGFSRHAQKIAADGSQDPDFFEFGTPAAHAQMSNFSCTKEMLWHEREYRRFGCIKINGANEPTIAMMQTGQWMNEQLSRVQSACDLQDSIQATYWLGYMAHAAQDLVFHQGISNAEHSYYDNVMDRKVDWGDDLPNKLKAAIHATETLMTIAQSQLPAHCWRSMQSIANGSPQKERSWDLRWEAIRVYKRLADIVDQWTRATDRDGVKPSDVFLAATSNDWLLHRDEYGKKIPLQERRWLLNLDNESIDALLSKLLGSTNSGVRSR